MFNGHKPHHPNVRFFLYFAERRGPGCCCAWADKKWGRVCGFRATARATATWAPRVFSRLSGKKLLRGFVLSQHANSEVS